MNALWHLNEQQAAGEVVAAEAQLTLLFFNFTFPISLTIVGDYPGINPQYVTSPVLQSIRAVQVKIL